MAAAFAWLSQELKQHPLRTNIVLSTCIGFCGDVICQTIYEPLIGIRRVAPGTLPHESFRSKLIFKVRSPALAWKHRRDNSNGIVRREEELNVYLDLRRSFIFCSFSCLFSVPYFLWVYKQLDRLYPPVDVTKMQAIYKGFFSYIAANLTTPLYMGHITLLDRFIIYRAGRDGRRRVPHLDPQGAASPSRGQLAKSSSSIATHAPPVYTIEDDRHFNREEYLRCVRHDFVKRLTNDFPDVLKYGLFFWGVNWLPMFYYIPPHFRLLYSACLQVAWSGIMSYMLHRGEK